MPKKLTRLRIDEGSLVDRPANPLAQMLLFKRHDDEPSALAKGETMPTENTEDLAAQLDELTQMVGDLTKANADLTAQLAKAAQPTLPLQPSAAEAALTKQVSEATEALKAANAALKAESEARKAAEEKLAKHEPTAPPEEDINLAELPAAVRRRLEDADALRKSVEESKKRIEKLDEERRIEKCAARIAKNWPSLPIKAEHFAPIFSKIEAALQKDEMRELERILTSHAEAMKVASSAIGREYVTAGSDAWQEILTKAEALRKVDSRLSKEQAIDEACQRFPDLYTKYREEQQQQVN